jgi:hypothetical protein
MLEEKGSFSSFVVKKYIDFHKGCEDLTSQACLDKYEDYLRNRISLPPAAVHLSMKQLRESYLFAEGGNEDGSPGALTPANKSLYNITNRGS